MFRSKPHFVFNLSDQFTAGSSSSYRTRLILRKNRHANKFKSDSLGYRLARRIGICLLVSSYQDQARPSDSLDPVINWSDKLNTQCGLDRNTLCVIFVGNHLQSKTICSLNRAGLLEIYKSDRLYDQKMNQMRELKPRGSGHVRLVSHIKTRHVTSTVICQLSYVNWQWRRQ